MRSYFDKPLRKTISYITNLLSIKKTFFITLFKKKNKKKKKSTKKIIFIQSLVCNLRNSFPEALVKTRSHF